MLSKKKFFENFNLYAVTSFDKVTPEIISLADQAYRGGAGILQLRLKSVSDGEYLRLGLKIREISRHYGRGFVINNRLDLALAVDADAVHVGQEDMPIEVIRSILEKHESSMLIGKSTHSLEQARAAEEEKVDYIGVGPIFSTPTKPDYQPVGLELIMQVRRKVKIPFVAIGGIHMKNLTQVIAAGATSVAVVRAIFSSANPYESTQQLKSHLDELRSKHVISL